MAALFRQCIKNANDVLPPSLSTEYEVGAKATVGNVLISAALFDINEALTLAKFANPGDALQTLTQDGRQENKGFEFSVGGKVLSNLTLWGGLYRT